MTKLTKFRCTTNRQRRPRRGGISLIEVLISIGVLGIGLLGVFALVPLASHQALQGVREDRKAAAGKRAYREFRIREMGNPANWVGQVVDGNRMLLPAYCIDPLAVAETGVVVFPAAGVPLMPRITLASQPGRGTINARAPLEMSLVQAQDVFTLQDDLAFDMPEDETLPPQRKPLSNEVNAKFYADGKFTWFATLMRELGIDNGLYRLSIAIAYERVPQIDVPGEKVASVGFLGGAAGQPVGYAGGDVHLTSTEPIESRVGDWLLLSQSVDGQAYFRWYRIVTADEREGEMEREFTLHGPDWPILAPASAIFVPHVVAVYEKTIQLETPSLWSSF